MPPPPNVFQPGPGPGPNPGLSPGPNPGMMPAVIGGSPQLDHQRMPLPPQAANMYPSPHQMDEVINYFCKITAIILITIYVLKKLNITHTSVKYTALSHWVTAFLYTA